MFDAAERLLTEWLIEPDQAQANETLSVLISLHAEPTVRRIVSYKLSGGAAHGNRSRSAADIDDICNESLRRLLSHLEALKSGSRQVPVKNFGNYAAVTAFNACNEYFRERSPARYRLSNKLRYLLTHSPLFALWETDEGLEACGLTAMAGRRPRTDIADLGFVRDSVLTTAGPALTEVVRALFHAAGSPLTFDLLFQAVAQCTGLREQQTQWIDSGSGGSAPPWEKLADPGLGAESGLAGRQYIARLWAEIRELPLQQRSALLLNLKDSAGGEIQIFDWLGIATVEQIAEVLEMDPLVFAEVWKHLPWDDARIASQLGISRQDVINRRSSARKRLANRLKESEGPKYNAKRANNAG